METYGLIMEEEGFVIWEEELVAIVRKGEGRGGIRGNGIDAVVGYDARADDVADYEIAKGGRGFECGHTIIEPADEVIGKEDDELEIGTAENKLGVGVSDREIDGLEKGGEEIIEIRFGKAYITDERE